MKYLSEFRSPEYAARLVADIVALLNPGRRYRLMEFCGGHTHAIFRHGLPGLLPAAIEFIHGPGCPVCVLPAGRIDAAIHLLQNHEPILCTYADLLRVPGAGGRSLLQARAAGADVRSVHSTQDALRIAAEHPTRQVVFFAIGFETTAPATAVAVVQAAAQGLSNFSVYCNHVLTPPAMRAILDAPQPAVVDGFLGPSHVSCVIGSAAYQAIVADYRKPVVIAGFEPLDVLLAVKMLVVQLNAGQCLLENEYRRAVSAQGNSKARAVMDLVFAVRPQFEWRGLGQVAASGLMLRPEYAAFDAENRFTMPVANIADHKGCECPAILRGHKKPTDCRLLGTACTPQHPVGPCMVSSEGACAAYWSYARNLGSNAQLQRASPNGHGSYGHPE